MRVVLIGASPLAVMSAQQLCKEGHEVVVVEQDADKIDELSDELDCGFVCADGSRPTVLNDVSPENTDVLCCVSNSDQDNIIAALVGRSLGFERVIVKVEEPDFEPVCVELGIDQVIVPDRKMAAGLCAMIEDHDVVDLGNVLSGSLRFFTFVATAASAGAVEALELPDECQVIAVTHADDSELATPATTLEAGDEVLVLTKVSKIEELEERFATTPK